MKVSITTTHKEGLVVGARSMPGNPYDGHTLAEALEQAAILSDIQPEIAVVDRGYKGVAIDGVKVYHPGLRRGICHLPPHRSHWASGIKEPGRFRHKGATSFPAYRSQSVSGI
ncbi:transposase domain protein [Burkholderia oklahomensis]|uniref:Transposase domain protein n=1 Tax=Burkholderia oklahomensis TaxID=342113 RepID=A0AAI8B7Y5_9BURK|nr:transposase domain protein [Burkholderia oklahomensis]